MKNYNIQLVAYSRSGLSEREIKKFFKKCKRQGIIEEYLEKTSFNRTRAEKKREKIRKNAYLRKTKKRRF